jgi:outer membrane beta-barrel protein
VQKALVVVSALWCVLPVSALAQVEELENPGTVSAIQDRAYRMQHELDLSVGVLPLDAFFKGLYAQVGYVYHFTDTFAWQVARGSYVYSVRTGLREQLERDFGVLPTQDVDTVVQFSVGSDLMWKPFYGKLTVLNRAVVHGEVFFLLGATLFKFTNAFRPAVNIGGGGRIFVSKYVSFRLDVTDNIALPAGGGSTGLLNIMAMTLSLGVNFGSTE